jgi:hypothetical protein
MDKINQLSLSEKLIAGGGILMLVASFLPWYSIDFGIEGFGSVSRNGWESPGAIWSVLAVLLGIAMVVVALGPKLAGMSLPDLGGVTWGQAMLGAGALVALCIIIKLINESSYMDIGFFLGILAAVALAAGGYLMYTEEKPGIVRR